VTEEIVFSKVTEGHRKIFLFFIFFKIFADWQFLGSVTFGDLRCTVGDLR
jgi:hypothetical protein